MRQWHRALAISRKDIASYYGKPPLITWGLMFPGVLLLSVYLKDPATYLQISPGLVAMTLLFASTSMSAIVITFEKRAGTFQRLLLAPLHLDTIIVGKTLSAAAYGLGTALILVLALAILLDLRLRVPGFFLGGLLLGAILFALMGLSAAMVVKEVFEAMTLMNFFRFPLLFISGVFMPWANFPAWLKPLAWLSPLTHIVALLEYGLTGCSHFPSPWLPLGISLVFLTLAAWAAHVTFQRRAYL
ncbi:MAG: ABC transporter permease [Desulfobacca sp.]|uniref:ABC transporter permease n=1 Tax=Desulfobacca sp. TaxID=2067990 RepID=UPI00404AEA4F